MFYVLKNAGIAQKFLIDYIRQRYMGIVDARI